MATSKQREQAREYEEAGDFPTIDDKIKYVIRCLESDHVQNNRHRLGALGSFEIERALQTLQEIVEAN